MADRSGRVIGAHGGYRKLRSFRVGRVIYDATVVFCERFIERGSRTRVIRPVNKIEGLNSGFRPNAHRTTFEVGNHQISVCGQMCGGWGSRKGRSGKRLVRVF